MTFRFELGDYICVDGNMFTKMRVIGRTEYIDGTRGYVCSHWSAGHNSLVKHTIAECEAELFESVVGQKKGASDDKR